MVYAPKVEDKYITLDASDRYCKFAMLPRAALNEQAFLLMGERPQWIPPMPYTLYYEYEEKVSGTM